MFGSQRSGKKANFYVHFQLYTNAKYKILLPQQVQILASLHIPDLDISSLIQRVISKLE